MERKHLDDGKTVFYSKRQEKSLCYNVIKSLILKSRSKLQDIILSRPKLRHKCERHNKKLLQLT